MVSHLRCNPGRAIGVECHGAVGQCCVAGGVVDPADKAIGEEAALAVRASQSQDVDHLQNASCSPEDFELLGDCTAPYRQKSADMPVFKLLKVMGYWAFWLINTNKIQG